VEPGGRLRSQGVRRTARVVGQHVQPTVLPDDVAHERANRLSVAHVADVVVRRAG
jgi:hypothetical protein